MDLKGNIFFDGPSGRIEGIWKDAAAGSETAAIVCHPHPLFGGTMHNKVVFRMARAFERRGYAVLRFNFRGTGRSDGEHDDGQGEQDDLRAAIRFLGSRFPYKKLWLAGFSFGAAVMLRLSCSDPSVFGIVSAGTPVGRYDLSEAAACGRPKLFVQGDRDQFGSVEDISRLVDLLPEPKEFKVIGNADHFFDGHLPELESIVSEYVSKFEPASLNASL